MQNEFIKKNNTFKTPEGIQGFLFNLYIVDKS